MSVESKTAEPPEYLDCPERGGRFKYDRQAMMNMKGQCDLSQLDVDEVVVWPGFIYRREP